MLKRKDFASMVFLLSESTGRREVGDCNWEKQGEEEEKGSQSGNHISFKSSTFKRCSELLWQNFGMKQRVSGSLFG